MELKQKLLILLAILFAAGILLLGIIVFLSGGKSPTDSFISPTGVPAPERKTGVTLSSKELQTLSVISPIRIRLTEAIDKNSIKYTITPRLETFITLSEADTLLEIKPTDFWVPDTTYKLIIQEVKGTTGKTILTNYIVQFKAINTDDDIESSAESTNNP